MNFGDSVVEKPKKKATPQKAKWQGQLSAQHPSEDLAKLQQQVELLAGRVLSLERETQDLYQAFSELEDSEDPGTDEEQLS